MINEYEKYDKGALLRGRYSKIADLSEGSYGLVSLAKDVSKGDKLVAVKFIYPLLYKHNKMLQNTDRATSSPARLRSQARFSSKEVKLSLKVHEEAVREIRIHLLLGTHVNISNLYELFDSYLILEYCSRGDLYEAIQKGEGPTIASDIKDVSFQIIKALEFCHSKSVYHRDLKPENILISDDWTIKICDWGLATTEKIITDEKEFDIGSERYMAPELFDQNLESYDASKIDLWSLGIVLLTIVFHKNPFQVANHSDKTFIQFAANRETLFDIFSTMSADMFSVLSNCLNIDPANRDLTSLKDEMELLKYFTIDDEYADVYDEEEYEAENLTDNEVEINVINDYNDQAVNHYPKGEADSFALEPANMQSVNADVDNYSSNEPNKDPCAEENDISKPQDNLKKINNWNSTDRRQVLYNRRAEALLSEDSELKAIPLADDNIRLVRNTRKPFNVATYNHNWHINGNRQGISRFNREEFFTPKSALNHFMDKLGDQRELTNKFFPNYHQDKNGRNARTWKRNTKGKSGKGNKKKNGSSDSKCDSDLGKPISFSRKTGQISNPMRNQMILNPLSKSLNAPSLSGGALGLPSHSGKYIPPFLRPGYKSPELLPLSEKVTSMTLEPSDDEVFHLEDDFESPYSQRTATSSPQVKIQHHQNNGISGLDSVLNFKKPALTAPSFNTLKNHSHFSTKSHHLLCQNPPNNFLHHHSDSGGTCSESESSCHHSDANAKYVPPFRRGSNPMTVAGAIQNGSKGISREEYQGKASDGNADLSSSLPVVSQRWLTKN